MTRDEIESAIVQLQHLLDDETTVEEDYQQWLETNPAVFTVLGYSRVLPHPRLLLSDGRAYVPDFMAQRVDGLWDIIEIKRPDTSVLKNATRRTSFYASVETYLSQCREYSTYFNDEAGRKKFESKYKSQIQSQPAALLFAGRSEGLDRQKIHFLLSGRVPSVLHQTYDDLLNQLELQRAHLYGDYEDLNGISIHCVLILDQPPEPYDAFILDIGQNLMHNRIRVFCGHAGELVIAVCDAFGVQHRASIRQSLETFSYDRPLYLSVEIGAGAEHSIIIVEINGQYCSEVHFRDLALDLEPPFHMVMGSDQEGKACSSMRLAKCVMYNRTLTFREKIDLRSFLFDKYERFLFGNDDELRVAEFHGHQFLYTEGHPRLVKSIDHSTPSTNLIQEVLSLRPILRKGNKAIAG